MADTDIVVVTGASGALGSALAERLAASGRRVAGIDRATPNSRSASEHIAHYVLEDASLDHWRAIVRRIESDLGPPHGAALVAGGWRGGAPLHDPSSADHWRAMLDANLDSARSALTALLPGMVARGGGSIVLVGSRAAERPWESAGAAAYAAAKSAAVALARTVAAEVLEHGVRVNAILPSTIDTPANRRAMPKADPARWVATESLADVIAFLLSDAARDVSGAALPVYGRA